MNLYSSSSPYFLRWAVTACAWLIELKRGARKKSFVGFILAADAAKALVGLEDMKGLGA